MRFRRPRRKTLFVGALAVAVPPFLVVVIANAVVLFGSNGTTDEVADAPHAQAAIVLGAQVRPDGTMSWMLEDRVETAARLYKAGKVDRVLVTGDHGRVGYDEPNTMKRALIERGVPPGDIFTDHAGFDTWDSVVRARKVFKVDSAIVVTQGFHMPRAVWLARRAGLTADGVTSDLRDYGRSGQKSQVREVLARVKAVSSVVRGADPKFLGPAIPITGDASASDG